VYFFVATNITYSQHCNVNTVEVVSDSEPMNTEARRLGDHKAILITSISCYNSSNIAYRSVSRHVTSRGLCILPTLVNTQLIIHCIELQISSYLHIFDVAYRHF